ncbi:MAG: sulfotransferase domain-containing protein [Sandarakinorhabdus sp.]|nr:sulfotransferase domain-containing protein [Sandarakinorhabdus sp.]
MLIRKAERVVQSWHSDSRVWDRLTARPGDIIVCTAPKCGTTWTQRIVSMLMLQSPAPAPVMQMHPWLDAFFVPHDIVIPMLEAQPTRRMLKTHLPFDAMPFHDDVLYIHTARDPRDACMSFHNHCTGFTDRALAGMDAQGLAIPEVAAPYPRAPADARDFFRRWLRDPAFAPLDDWTCAEYFDLQRSYWAIRNQPNVLMVHYNDLKADLDGEMRRIAAFIGIETPAALWPELVEAATFAAMRRDGDAILGMAVQSWKEGGKTFMNKGTNDRWRGLLTDADLADYDAAASAGMTPAMRAWAEGGTRVAGDPKTAAD